MNKENSKEKTSNSYARVLRRKNINQYYFNNIMEAIALYCINIAFLSMD